MRHSLFDTSAPLVCLTAYTAPMAKIIAPYVDMILVGDSVGMVLYGMENTLGVTPQMIGAHTQAVRRGAPDAFIIADMPYGTYEEDKSMALKTAQYFINECGANAVKLEGGVDMAPVIQHLTTHEMPVMGHIGLLPQSVEKEGGYKIKGKTDAGVQALIADAKAIEGAGAFAYVLEGTKEDAARQVVEAVSIPAIGIGASAACAGQVLVTEDMIGLSGGYLPKFVKPYADVSKDIEAAIKDFAGDVRRGDFPSEEYVY